MDFFFGDIEGGLVWVNQGDVHTTMGSGLSDTGAHLTGANDGDIVDSVGDFGRGRGGSYREVLENADERHVFDSRVSKSEWNSEVMTKLLKVTKSFKIDSMKLMKKD